MVIDDLGSGGAQNQITTLAKGLSENGYNVSLLVYHPSDFFAYRLKDTKVEIIYHQKTSKLGIGVILFLRKTIVAKKIDVVISFLETPNFFASVAAKILTRRRLFISYRSSTDFESRSYLSLLKLRFCNHLSDSIVANSHHERKNWNSRFPRQKDKWHTIYNAVEKSEPPLKDLSTKDDYLVIGSIGPAKNGLLVIEALKLLAEKNKKIKINWIGQQVFHLEDRRLYLEQMNRLLEQYQLESQWKWTVPTQEITHEYRTHKALILASQTEGLPNVVCEAMAEGLPCLVSDTLDHPLLIEDNKTGFLFNPKDPFDLAEKINKMEQLSSERYAEMKKNCKSKADELFGVDNFVKQYISLIEL